MRREHTARMQRIPIIRHWLLIFETAPYPVRDNPLQDRQLRGAGMHWREYFSWSEIASTFRLGAWHKNVTFPTIVLVLLATVADLLSKRGVFLTPSILPLSIRWGCTGIIAAAVCYCLYYKYCPLAARCEPQREVASPSVNSCVMINDEIVCTLADRLKEIDVSTDAKFWSSYNTRALWTWDSRIVGFNVDGLRHISTFIARVAHDSDVTLHQREELSQAYPNRAQHPFWQLSLRSAPVHLLQDEDVGAPGDVVLVRTRAFPTPGDRASSAGKRRLILDHGFGDIADLKNYNAVNRCLRELQEYDRPWPRLLCRFSMLLAWVLPLAVAIYRTVKFFVPN